MVFSESNYHSIHPKLYTVIYVNYFSVKLENFIKKLSVFLHTFFPLFLRLYSLY